MTTEVLHPDHLQPGSMVGPWRIVEVLGAGSFGRVFKAERDGSLYALKMALRPAAAERQPGEEDVDGRFAQEVAVLLAHTSQPGLLRVHAVDRWPDARAGYRYFVTDYVEGDTFHSWRWRARPSTARLVEVFSELVHTVGELHRRGVHHRDLKAENILVRREDERPFLIDFGTVRLPGASALTVGSPPPGTLHIQPPEVAAFILDGAWKEGARFDAGAAGDLYALGVLLYEALADGHPFRPSLGTEQLLVAIETVVPRAPHYINPQVPLPLSRICMRLLSKRPEERFESAEALLQSLWVASKGAQVARLECSLGVAARGARPDDGAGGRGAAGAGGHRVARRRGWTGSRGPSTR